MNTTQAIVEVPEQWPESAAEMGRLMQSVEAAESLCKLIRQAVKQRLEEDMPVDGWTLRPGNKRRDIVDPEGIYRELRDSYGVSPDEFLKCCTVNLSKLQSLFQFKGPEGSLVENKKALDGLIKPYTKEKQGAPVLKKLEGITA